MNNLIDFEDTICAISTPTGMGAIALIRLSGKKSWQIAEKCCDLGIKTTIVPQKVKLADFKDNNSLLDQVMLTFFKNPHSFTGEDMVEISCHGSTYIQKRIIEILINNGCRYANRGEFTMRAFLNGKMDLSQSEAIADVVASDSQASLQLAIKGLKGEISTKIKQLREQLLYFASMLELELDFSEEDLEFADKKLMQELIAKLRVEIECLVNSFSLGNAIKTGIPVAIVGAPNVGKSTLLNALLDEERAIVSDIPGTTRDAIEDTLTIEGQLFRFIDTAGIRQADDEIEKIGISRTFQAIDKAMLVFYLIDASQIEEKETFTQLKMLLDAEKLNGKKVLILANKSDLLTKMHTQTSVNNTFETIFLSAKQKENINFLTQRLSLLFPKANDQILLSNIRHYEALKKGLDALLDAQNAFENAFPSDLIATNIRHALYHLGEVLGEISNEEILSTIFSKFCIGK